MEGFLGYRFEGLILGGALWRSLFLEFYGRLSVENLLITPAKAKQSALQNQVHCYH